MELKRLGPYEIGRPLGKGGMGSVFAAVDARNGHQVAIKALTPHLAMAEGFRERFEAEIESLKILRHDGIVRLYGYGEQDGVLFYSMELVHGISLEDELKAGRRFNWRDVSSIAIQLALALKHAHDHGIVHRDIKPANVLLYDEDRVKLADFGIARLFGATQLTTAGGVLGTADYMSPEQADGRPITARCDQYSLGGVMYTLLAGRPPFQAKNLPQMLQLQRFAKPEPVRRYAPDAPEQLERVIMQLLAKNPLDRFPNTQVLARHLQAMVKALSRPASDEFALSGESRALDPLDAPPPRLLPTDATQLEPTGGQPGDPQHRIANRAMPVSDSHEALTLAADESMTDPPVICAASSSAEPSGARATATRPAIRATHFTTVEEEEARRRAEQSRSWLVIAAQLALLVAVLTAMGAVAVYLSRPPSADELYNRITSHGVAADDVSVTHMETEIRQFLERYPADPRSRELAQYQEGIALDKAERRLQREARGGSSSAALVPVERLYLHAVSFADSAPDLAISMLRSIVDLYGVDALADSGTQIASAVEEKAADAASRVSVAVRLAKRRLAALQEEIAQQREAHLVELDERLERARRLSSSDRPRAAAMYRAIIDLHGHDAWAERVVGEARSQLARLESLPQ